MGGNARQDANETLLQMRIPGSWVDFFRYRHADFELELASGERLSVRCPVVDRPKSRRSFVFAFHKSGSVLLNGMIDDLCRFAKVPVLNLPEILFRKGVKWAEVASVPAGLFDQEGVVFSGFRHMPGKAFSIRFREDDAVILLVRDPRDILVSLYFSMKFSHSLPKAGGVRNRLEEQRKTAESMEIDDYVIDAAPALKKQYDSYRKGLLERDDIDTRIFRYEEVIFEKERWMADLAEHLGLALPEAQRKRIVAKHDVVPEREDPSSHVRRVAPGDHAEKLSQETIAYLNEFFREVVSPFGYSL